MPILRYREILVSDTLFWAYIGLSLPKCPTGGQNYENLWLSQNRHGWSPNLFRAELTSVWCSFSPGSIMVSISRTLKNRIFWPPGWFWVILALKIEFFCMSDPEGSAQKNLRSEEKFFIFWKFFRNVSKVSGNVFWTSQDHLVAQKDDFTKKFEKSKKHR